MPAAIYDIVIEQGATFQKTVVLKDSDGSPRDLTGKNAIENSKYYSELILKEIESELRIS